MLRFLRRRRRLTPEQQEQRDLLLIRAHFAAFGYDLSDMTDDELRAGVQYACEIAAQSGVTMAQAAKGMQQALAPWR